MMGELDYNDYERYPVITPTGMEVKDPELARKVKAISALRTPVNYVELPENKLGQHGTTGMDPNKNFININKDLFGKALSSTLVHEGDHAVQTQMPFIKRTTQPVKHKLKPEYDVDSYMDKPNEIRSRIMETRKFFNLDPAKRDYTPNEAAEMQKQLMEAGQSAGSASQLNRLTPETMAGYLNYLASNDTKKSSNNVGMSMYEEGVNYAAKGGILKAQEGTGNLYAPHPLSPVGIALNQARAMVQGKKDQQHLPPGVKEVVGPDGKKVAIRTEQPLQPMSQEAAA
jgi:hypothetical protein